MKNVITMVFLFFAMFCFSQTAENTQLENLKIELNINSADQLSELKINELKTILKNVEKDSNLQLIINCNNNDKGESSFSKRTKVSYKVNGNMNNEKEFIAMTKRIKKAVKKYYKKERKG